MQLFTYFVPIVLKTFGYINCFRVNSFPNICRSLHYAYLSSETIHRTLQLL